MKYHTLNKETFVGETSARRRTCKIFGINFCEQGIFPIELRNILYKQLYLHSTAVLTMITNLYHRAANNFSKPIGHDVWKK